MATKNVRKTIFGKSCQMILALVETSPLKCIVLSGDNWKICGLLD